jgi:hypothetical protein
MLRPNFGLVLVYRKDQKVLPIAYVSDSRMIKRAAQQALSEARGRAKILGKKDPALAALHAAEAKKLRAVFSPLIGGARDYSRANGRKGMGTDVEVREC